MSAIHNADVSRSPEAGAALLGRSAALAALQNAVVSDRFEQRFKMTHLSNVIAESGGMPSLAGAIAKFAAAQTRPMLHAALSRNAASTIKLANFDRGIASVASAYLDSVRAARTMVGLLGGPARVREDAGRTLGSAAMESLGDIRKSLDELGAARD